MQFRTLRLAGFKSFVEPAEIEIAPGLTGIVGPNGCGKSNIVEALRWAMGETSAKRMRGGEMDDVIFSGSGKRPARNIAEVTLIVANDGSPIPAMFETFPELEVRRRIERGAGSDYRVNGRPVRARDVQLLFADAAIGSSSPAMVSQGRISALIAAKPAERRFILEDAAGIGGLQSRRHEAELKLKAAEANLGQLETVLDALRTQEGALKRQARQAEKYRQLAERIREIEALLLYCAWTEATARLDTARQGFEAAETTVRATMADVASAAARESTADANVIVTRQADSQAQATLRDVRAGEQALQAEQRQIETARAQAERDIARSEGDLQHEERERDEAQAALARLAAETLDLQAAQPKAAETVRVAEAAERSELEAVRSAEQSVLSGSTAIARAETEAAALARQVRDAEARCGVTTQRLEAARREMTAAGQATTGQDIVALQQDCADARTALQQAEAAIEPARTSRTKAEAEAAQARENADEARGTETRLKAEIAGLEAGLAGGANSDTVNAVLQEISAQAGFEAALAAALGEEAWAAANNGPYRWADLPPTQLAPPQGTQALAGKVEIPPALRRTLAGIGIASATDAARLQDKLAPGQAIVTEDGSLFRWDGLVREAGWRSRAGAPDPIAATLARRNRLAELQVALKASAQQAATAIVAQQAAREAAEKAARQEREATQAVATALGRVQRSDATLATAQARQEQAQRHIEQARLALESLTQQAGEADTTLKSLQVEQRSLPDIAKGRETLRVAEQRLSTARMKLSAGSAATRQSRQAVDALGARLGAIGGETMAWQERAHTRGARLAEITRRIAAAHGVLADFGDRPAKLMAELTRLTTKVEEVEQTCRVTAAAAIRAETDLAEQRREARQAEQRLGQTREDRVRAESAMTVAREARDEMRALIADRLHVTVEDLAATLDGEGDIPERAELEQRLAALTREREALGAVNLRAETELQEAATAIARVETERADLAEAIARLRQAIGKLNREARERLTAAFEVVRVHFKRLFATLFGGGEAELALTEMDDPLEAGLEIFASPPGKKLQILSLLSGGEQALTALALLFAMFLATPAPVCVLDEVDAPLDDANVTRFCDLLDEIAATTGTRFLVITHHRVTMARMDRLYGVTMAERGVSMLVSVDLKAAETLVDHEVGDMLPLRARGGTR